MPVTRQPDRAILPPLLAPETTYRLLERARAGDEAALEQLFARYLEPLRRWARGRLPGWARDARDTQDLVQETLLQTFKRLDTFEYRGEGALQAYLRQALLNNIRCELRRFQRRAPTAPLDSQITDESPSPLEQAVGAEASERYEAALAQLRPADREAIIARIELGLPYPEVAAALGKPSIPAAHMAVSRALVRLAQEMSRGTAR